MAQKMRESGNRGEELRLHALRVSPPRNKARPTRRREEASILHSNLSASTLVRLYGDAARIALYALSATATDVRAAGKDYQKRVVCPRQGPRFQISTKTVGATRWSWAAVKQTK